MFITCLSFENGQLLVTNERGLHFRIDTTTHEVLGDPCGCDTTSSGCAGEADGGDGGSTPSGDAASSSRPAMHAPGACSVAPRGPPAVALLALLAMLAAPWDGRAQPEEDRVVRRELPELDRCPR